MSVVGDLAGKSADAASTAVSGAATGAAQTAADSTLTRYGIDRLFRSNSGAGPDASRTEARPEVARIVSPGLSSGNVPADDRNYLSRLVAAHAGMSESEATQRVEQSREAADTARKATATASIFLAFSMVIGAFISSAAAAVGGQRRDLHP